MKKVARHVPEKSVAFAATSAFRREFGEEIANANQRAFETPSWAQTRCSETAVHKEAPTKNLPTDFLVGVGIGILLCLTTYLCLAKLSGATSTSQ